MLLLRLEIHNGVKTIKNMSETANEKKYNNIFTSLHRRLYDVFRGLFGN